MIRILSIERCATTRPQTSKWGQYIVVIELDHAVQVFEYTCELSVRDGFFCESVTWTPNYSALPGLDTIDLMTRIAITDTIMQYHKGFVFSFPRVVLPHSLDPDTTVV